MIRIKLHWWIIIGMIFGAVVGAMVHAIVPADQVTETAAYEAFNGLSEIFLKLLKMIVVPLVVFSLLSGLLGLGSLRRLGRLGGKTFGLYMLTSLLAIIMGLALVNLIGPGVGTDIQIPTERLDKDVPDSFWDVLLDMVPMNFIDSAARFDLIQVIVFTLFFGAFLLAVPEERRTTMTSLIETGAEVMMLMTRFIISLAPIGIAALIARLVSTTGLEVFLAMGPYIVTIALSLGGHLLITLPLLIWLFTRRNPYRFLRAMSPALVTGFSTASSSGTLGVTMSSIQRTGVSNRIASFVLPLGATINMDGTALYEIVSVLFVAQIHAGIDPTFTLTFGQQLLIVFLGLTVSVGAAGIPHAGLVMMVIILQAVGLPVEYTALIWTVDRVLDMCRTGVNLASDSSVALIVAHGEGEIDDSVMWNNPDAA